MEQSGRERKWQLQMYARLFLGIIYYENRTQSTSKKKTNTDKKRHKNTDTHIKKNEEINPKDESRNQPVHRAVMTALFKIWINKSESRENPMVLC